MKIFINDKVYVQIRDLLLPLGDLSSIPMPESVDDKTLELLYKNYNSNNDNEFIEFSKPEEVEFFKACEWIEDYNNFDDMTLEEMEEYKNKLEEAKKSLIVPGIDVSNLFISMSLVDIHKYSVNDIIRHKNGDIIYPLPEGTRESYFIKEENIITPIIVDIKPEMEIEGENITTSITEEEFVPKNKFQKVLKKAYDKMIDYMVKSALKD